MELGWVDGRNIIAEWRYADTRPERLAVLAAELVQQKVAVIVAGGAACINAVRAVTTTIPIIAIGGADPVAVGWAQSLSRPGGNTTGFTVTVPELGPKHLELFKAAVPGHRRMAVMFSPSDFNLKFNRLILQSGAQALGLDLQWLEVGAPADFEPALALARQGRAQGLYAPGTNLIVTHRRPLAEQMARQRLPSISDFPLMAHAGFMLSYGADLDALGRRAAGYVDKILRGAVAGELPFEQPTRFELIANLTTARATGVTLPATFMLQVDRVIW